MQHIIYSLYDSQFPKQHNADLIETSRGVQNMATYNLSVSNQKNSLWCGTLLYEVKRDVDKLYEISIKTYVIYIDDEADGARERH